MRLTDYPCFPAELLAERNDPIVYSRKRMMTLVLLEFRCGRVVSGSLQSENERADLAMRALWIAVRASMLRLATGSQCCRWNRRPSAHHRCCRRIDRFHSVPAARLGNLLDREGPAAPCRLLRSSRPQPSPNRAADGLHGRDGGLRDVLDVSAPMHSASGSGEVGSHPTRS